MAVLILAVFVASGLLDIWVALGLALLYALWYFN